nr:MTH938/NDUFAF3 family protein [Tepidamorphus gemmatus]
MREAHYPGLAPIEAYGNGGFRFAGMSHRGSLLIAPDGIHGWSVTSPSEINVGSLVRILEAEARPELLLLGTGADIVAVPRDLRAALSSKGIRLEVMATGAAVRTYNVLLAEKRSVGAALIAVA